MGMDWRTLMRALLDHWRSPGGDLNGDGRGDELERIRREQERLLREQARQRQRVVALERRVRGLQEQVTVLVRDGE